MCKDCFISLLFKNGDCGSLSTVLRKQLACEKSIFNKCLDKRDDIVVRGRAHVVQVRFTVCEEYNKQCQSYPTVCRLT